MGDDGSTSPIDLTMNPPGKGDGKGRSATPQPKGKGDGKNRSATPKPKGKGKGKGKKSDRDDTQSREDKASRPD